MTENRIPCLTTRVPPIGFPPTASTGASPPALCLNPLRRLWSFWTSISWISHVSTLCNFGSATYNDPFYCLCLARLYSSFSLKSKFLFSRKFSWSTLAKVHHWGPNHIIHLLLLHSCIMIHLFNCWKPCCLRVESEYFLFPCLHHPARMLIPYNTNSGQLEPRYLSCAEISVFLYELSWI